MWPWTTKINYIHDLKWNTQWVLRWSNNGQALMWHNSTYRTMCIIIPMKSEVTLASTRAEAGVRDAVGDVQLPVSSKTTCCREEHVSAKSIIRGIGWPRKSYFRRFYEYFLGGVMMR